MLTDMPDKFKTKF